MRDGKYEARDAALRMKHNLEDGDPSMWDLFAYPITEKEHRTHHRTGDTWRIYPTYDYTHCLSDSFECITHSRCTTEFELSRVSYEWLCDELEVYRPMQREWVSLPASFRVRLSCGYRFRIGCGYRGRMCPVSSVSTGLRLTVLISVNMSLIIDSRSIL